MDETLLKLKVQLDLQDWPDVYLFKFIVPNDVQTVAQATALFDATSNIVMHASKNNKYMSISAKELMLDVESVLEKYRKASLIKGIISL